MNSDDEVPEAERQREHVGAADSEVEPDSESDPAHDDSLGNDWSSEGGATPEGPAANTED